MVPQAKMGQIMFGGKQEKINKNENSITFLVKHIEGSWDWFTHPHTGNCNYSSKGESARGLLPFGDCDFKALCGILWPWQHCCDVAVRLKNLLSLKAPDCHSSMQSERVPTSELTGYNEGYFALPLYPILMD